MTDDKKPDERRETPKADATNNERLNALMQKLYPLPAPIKYSVVVRIKP